MAPANLIGREPGKQTEVGIRTIRQFQDLASYAFQSETCPQHGPPSTKIFGWQRGLDPAQPATDQQDLHGRAERPFEPQRVTGTSTTRRFQRLWRDEACASSLDGVAEDPDKFLTDWDDDVMDANMSAVIDTQDAVILGRRSYDGGSNRSEARRRQLGNCSWITASFVSPRSRGHRYSRRVATNAEALHRLRRTGFTG